MIGFPLQSQATLPLRVRTSRRFRVSPEFHWLFRRIARFSGLSLLRSAALRLMVSIYVECALYCKNARLKFLVLHVISRKKYYRRRSTAQPWERRRAYPASRLVRVGVVREKRPQHRLALRADQDCPLFAPPRGLMLSRRVHPDRAGRVKIPAAHPGHFAGTHARQSLGTNHGLNGCRQKREDCFHRSVGDRLNGG